MRGSRASTRTAITKRRGCFLFPPNWPQSLLSQRCLAQNKATAAGMLHTSALQKRGRSLLPGSVFFSTANMPIQQAAKLACAYFCAGHSQVSHRWGCTQTYRRPGGLLSIFSMWLKEHSKAPADFVCSVPQRRKSMWELQMASALQGNPGCFPMETEPIYS